jgi:flavin reductase (DIM6/NTAB) family NADH-FMN oxidoreductase RutF
MKAGNDAPVNNLLPQKLASRGFLCEKNFLLDAFSDFIILVCSLHFHEESFMTASTTASGNSTFANTQESSGTTCGAQLDKDAVGKAIGRIASGVYIVTAHHAGETHGVLATWVAQAGFEPPMVAVTLNKQRPITPVLQTGAKFTINVLSKNNMDVFKAFAAPAKEGVDRFAGLPVKAAPQAGPVFEKSVAFLDCTVENVVELSDHTLVIGRIFHGDTLDSDSEPMVHLRKNGFQY